jgi:hypothetical protein
LDTPQLVETSILYNDEKVIASGNEINVHPAPSFGQEYCTACTGATIVLLRILKCKN